jgi:4-carboxymuconolactone decarboxylase
MIHPQSSYRRLEQELESGLDALETPLGADFRTRGLALCAAATADGRRDVLRAALRVGLGRGIHAGLLREVLLQTYLFAGYPRAINALAELAALAPPTDTPAQLDLAIGGDEADWVNHGQALCREVYGEKYERLLTTMAHISPELGRWMVLEGYGKVLSRPGLDKKLRELTAVGALVPLAVPNQLRAHLRGALLMGASPSEVTSVLGTAALVAPGTMDDATTLLRRVEDEAMN